VTIGSLDGGILRRSLWWAAVLWISVAVAACESPDQDGLLGGLFKPRQQERDTTTLTERGLGKLAKGEFLQAGEFFDNALRQNPRDVHALAGRGLVFMRAGQKTQARAAFEAVLALRPDPSIQMVVTGNPEPRPVADIASVNLALLDSSGVTTGVANGAPNMQTTGAPVERMPPAQSTLMVRQPPADALRPQMASAQHGDGAATGGLTREQANIAARFEALARLRDEGLVTPAEYAVRRRVNIGALLPLSHPGAATGLDRPVPPSDQISQRLRAIGRGLEMRAITVEQHVAERSMIVDGLLPEKPLRRDNPPLPPTGLMEAAAAVGQLEQLRDRGLITSDEYSKERAAIEAGMQPQAPAAPAQASTAPDSTQAPAAPAASGPRPGVHLASFRTEQAANRAWPQLRRAHDNLLGNLSPEITRIDLGPGKGVFYRLKAGPLTSQAAVEDLCRSLKARRQYCEPTFIGG
jgi:tetratricopeptide (TPR) repeat protein